MTERPTERKVPGALSEGNASRAAHARIGSDDLLGERATDP
jgi:hypothetical protein